MKVIELKNNMQGGLILSLLGVGLFFIGETQGQTTLTGDHIITGDLNVGTTANKGNLTVTGETGNTAAPGIKVTGDGGVVFGGTFGVGQVPTVAEGPRLLWYPKKAAFLVGRSYGTSSDSAAGVDSIALGSYASAIGENSCAIGAEAFAETAGSIALGAASYTNGEDSVAIGLGSWAGGQNAVAIGLSSNSFGIESLAFGECLTLGDRSVAIGYRNMSEAAYSVVVGRGGMAEGDPLYWIAEDPLFVVGELAPLNRPELG